VRAVRFISSHPTQQSRLKVDEPRSGSPIMDIQNLWTSSSLRLGSTGLLLRLNETKVSRDHDGDGEGWMLPKADYRAVTVKLILGNIRRGDDPAEGGAAPLSRRLYPYASTGFLYSP
jgi:hypothetical protein